MERKLHQNEKKHCSACDRWLPFEAYHRNRRNWDGLHAYCKECMSRTAARRYEREKDRLLDQCKKYRTRNRRKRKDGQLRVRFGVTLEEYDRLLAEQEGGCAICGGNGKRALHVDHCHETGRVRGLLCFRCNGALGSFRDSETLLTAAMEYLRKHRAESISHEIPVRVQRDRGG